MNEHAFELKGGLNQTKRKLNTLKFVEIWEKYSLYGSLLFFCLVSTYIILKRTKIVLYIFYWIASLISSHATGSTDSCPPEDVAPPSLAGTNGLEGFDGAESYNGIESETNYDL